MLQGRQSRRAALGARVLAVVLLTAAVLVAAPGARAHALQVCTKPCAVVANEDDYTVAYNTKGVTLNVTNANGVLLNDAGPSTTVVDLPDTVDDPGSPSHAVTTMMGYTATINGGGGFTYKADPDFSGIDSFDYFAWDSTDHDNYDVNTVYITVVPTVQNDIYSMLAGRTLIVPEPGLAANDAGTDPFSITVDDTSANGGSIIDNGNGAFQYTPRLGFSGIDTFTYDSFDMDYDNDYIANVSVIVNATVPDPPTNVAAAGGNALATVSFVPPASNGGVPISSYTATCTSSNGGTTRTGTGTASPIAVTSLTNDKTYTCTTTATNSKGTSVASAASSSFVPTAVVATVPGPPTNVVAAPANASVSVAFSAPASDGGATITGYSVSCVSSNGGATGSGSGVSSPIAVSNLTNGKSYSCTVTASNVIGAGAPSAPSNGFVPATVPGAPTGVVATAGAGSASVAFSAPASDGGATITGYSVSCVSSNGGATGSGSGVSSPIAVSNLTNGKSYSCTVTASNVIGAGAPSAPSNGFVPATVPGAPTGVVATAGAGSASVAFSAPASDGGATITGYSVSCVSSNGGATGSGSGVSSPIAVSNLTNGKSYSCTVTASNVIGAGAPSAPSNGFVPATVPGAPTGVVATAGAGSASVAFTAPANNGGSAITDYAASCTSSNSGVTGTANGSSSPIAVAGLTVAKSYMCTVTASNGVGSGSPSAASNAFVPVGCASTCVGVGDATVMEGNAGKHALTFRVSLSNPSSVPVTVGYTLTGDTATVAAKKGADVDVLAKASSTVQFKTNAKGITPVVVSVTVNVLGDTTVEPNETFTLHLTSVTGADIGRATATGTIIDDDNISGLSLGVGDASIVEGNVSGRSLLIPVTLSSSAAVTFTYTVGGGSATYAKKATVAGADYGGKQSGTFTFKAGGGTTHMISIPIWGDTRTEGDETFTITIGSTTAGVSIARAVGTGTIIDDD